MQMHRLRGSFGRDWPRFMLATRFGCKTILFRLRGRIMCASIFPSAPPAEDHPETREVRQSANETIEMELISRSDTAFKLTDQTSIVDSTICVVRPGGKGTTKLRFVLHIPSNVAIFATTIHASSVYCRNLNKRAQRRDTKEAI